MENKKAPHSKNVEPALERMQGKDTQKSVIFRELFKEPQNSKMLHVNTGIPREDICRRKRDLEDQDLLFVLKHDYCPYTGRLTQFLTTNPQTFRKWNQQSK